MAKDEAYRNAEKKIEAARLSGATRLDLSAQWYFEKTSKLTELPESLGQLTQLQALDLSNNQLTTLPDSLGQLTKLQSLNLSHNPLSSLPGFIGRLQRLEVLDLGCNTRRQEGISLDSDDSPSSYAIYDEVRERIGSLPEELFDLSNLRRLDLSGNTLTAIPSGISKLISLELLDLFGNHLTTLPLS